MRAPEDSVGARHPGTGHELFAERCTPLGEATLAALGNESRSRLVSEHRRAALLEQGRAEDRLVHRPCKDYKRDGLSRPGTNDTQHVLRESGGEAAVDHDHAIGGDDESLVGDMPAVSRLASSRAPTKTCTPCPRSIGSGYGAVCPVDAMNPVAKAAIARASIGYAFLACCMCLPFLPALVLPALALSACSDGSERE